MALCVNQSGTWREITTQCVNQSGTWRNVELGCINQSGTWRRYGLTTLVVCEGGYLICQASSVQWIVAPAPTEVSRNWYCRNDAVTTAQVSAACGDWFVPTCGQLKNPGYSCRYYWDSFSFTDYWSSTQFSTPCARAVSFINGSSPNYKCKQISRCVRAFRCVSY